LAAIGEVSCLVAAVVALPALTLTREHVRPLLRALTSKT
jgi:hypothetical protein